MKSDLEPSYSIATCPDANTLLLKKSPANCLHPYKGKKKEPGFFLYLIWFLIFFGIIESFAAMLMVEPDFGTGNTFPKRNPFFRRGWATYTSLLAKTPQKRLVIIGNSQAFGRELFEDDIYSSRLNSLVNQAKSSDPTGAWRVENWGVPGAIGPDLVLLTAKALQQQADVVLVVSYFQNFNVNRRTVTFSFSDIPQVAGEPSVLAKLPWSFLTKYVGVENVLSCFLDRMVLSRKTALQDYLQQHSDLNFELIFGQEARDKETNWFAPPAKGFSRLVNTSHIPRDDIVVSDADPAFVDYFCQMAAKSQKTKLIFVAMPLCKTALTSEVIERIERFNQLVEERIKYKANMRFWNMTWSLPPEHFYSYTHFDPVNHNNMADLIFKKLVGEGII